MLDADAEDGKEIQASGGTGHWEKFVHIEGKEGLKPEGYIGYMPFNWFYRKGRLLAIFQ